MATAQPLPGVQQSHFDNAARILDELRINDAKHRHTILTSAAHVAEVNRFNHDLKTGKVKASRNPGGLLLVRLGLAAPKTKAPAEQRFGQWGSKFFFPFVLRYTQITISLPYQVSLSH